MEGTRTQQLELEQLKRDVDALKRLGVTGGLSLTRGAGGQIIIGGAAASPAAGGLYAQIGTRTGARYAWTGVARDAAGALVTTDKAGTVAAGTYAEDIGGSSVDLVGFGFDPVLVLLTPNPLKPGCYLFGPINVCPTPP